MIDDIKNYVKRAMGRPRALIAGYATIPQGMFAKELRSRKNIEKYQRYYETGGIITEALNCYPNTILSQSGDDFTYVGSVEDEGTEDQMKEQVDLIQDILTYQNMYEIILDAVVTGDSFAFKEMTLGGEIKITPKNSAHMKIVDDAFGKVKHYVYQPDESKPGTVIKIEDVIHIVVRGSITHSNYGISYVASAFDDINADADTYQAATAYIKRYGFPSVGVQMPSQASDADVAKTKSEFKNMRSKDMFVYFEGTELKNIHETGSSNVAQYSQVTMERCMAALGVSLEMMQISSGSPNKSTSQEIIKAFANKMLPLQSMLNSQLWEQLWHPILVKSFADPIKIHIDFGDPSAQTLEQKSVTVKNLTGNAMDPYYLVDEDEARDMLNLPPREERDPINEPDED